MNQSIKIYLGNFNRSIFRENRNLYVYLYSNYMFSILKISESSRVYILDNNCVGIETTEVFISQKNSVKIENSILDFLAQLQFYKNFKIKFSGKGYKLKKTSKNSSNLMFNRAHITYVWWRHINAKKLRKYKLYLYGLRAGLMVSRAIVGVRSVNIFTKRGLRVSRQLLYKKKGKK